MIDPEESEEPTNRYLKWILFEPDDRLILAYFYSQAGEKTAAGLSPTEHRWVVLNLKCNPLWKARWRDLETVRGCRVSTSTSFGNRPVVLQSLGSVRVVAAAMGFLLIALTSASVLVLLGNSVRQDSTSNTELTAVVRGSPNSDDVLADGYYYLKKAARRGTESHPDEESLRQAIALLTVAYASHNDASVRSNAAYRIAIALRSLGDACRAGRWFELVGSDGGDKSIVAIEQGLRSGCSAETIR